MDVNLRDLPPWVIATVTLGMAVGAFLMGWLRNRLAGDFARKGDVEAMGGRIGGLDTRLAHVETRIASMPDHADIRALGVRVGEVERGVAVVSARLDGLAQLLGKVDRGVDMLLQNELREEDPRHGGGPPR